MSFITKKKILAALILIPVALSSQVSQPNGAWNSVERRNSNQTQEKTPLETVTENNRAVNAAKFDNDKRLSALYSRNRIRTGLEFELDRPLTVEDAYNLNHPYFQDILNRMDGKSLSDLAQMETNAEFSKLRLNSIYNEGLKFGTQSALYEVLYEFNKDLELMGDYYDRLFNFSILMLANGRVRPPVIIVKEASLEKENARQLRRTDRSVEIYKQAEVVTRPPNYIDYLNFTPIKPNPPQNLLLPRKNNQEEIEAWADGVKRGWFLGVRQANAVINEGLFSLQRDYTGMGEFYLASKQGQISQPQYQSMNLGITTDGNFLNIGEETFSIQILPQFNNDAQNWTPLPRIENFLDLNGNKVK